MKTYKLINYPRITFFLALFSITLLMACSSKSLSPEMKKLNSQEELLSLNTKLNKLKIALEKEGLSNADLKEQVKKINEDASISSKRAKEISEELSNNPGDSKLAKQAEKFAKKSSRDAKKASKLNQELNDNQKEMEDLEKKIKDLEGSLKDLESKINYVPNPQN